MDKRKSKIVVLSNQRRRVYQTKCSNCGKAVWKRKFQIETYKTHFCNFQCLSEYRKRGITTQCANCGKEVYRKLGELKSKSRKSKRAFCSRSCATSFNNAKYKSGKNSPNWKDGRGIYRARALKYYGHRCMNPKCPITQAEIPIPARMLDVNHKDGNRSNNQISNLEVLCLWCHGFKTRN